MKVVAELCYERIKQIGIGEGMNSEVYLCRDPQVGGEVAIKEIPKASFGNIVSKLGIPVKVNADSGGKPNGIPERR